MGRLSGIKRPWQTLRIPTVMLGGRSSAGMGIYLQALIMLVSRINNYARERLTPHPGKEIFIAGSSRLETIRA